MTCIVAIGDGTAVHMAADSGCTKGFNLAQLEQSKLFIRGELLIGDSGSVRSGQVLRHCFEPPKIDKGDSLTAYFATSFAAALRSAMSNCGVHRDDWCELLIGARGRVFHLTADGAVTVDPRQPYHAIGGAAAYALGAMYASSHGYANDLSPEDRLYLALAAARHHAVGILQPFTCLSLPSAAKGGG